MLLASLNNILLTVAFVLTHQLVPRTWGSPTSEALKVPNHSVPVLSDFHFFGVII